MQNIGNIRNFSDSNHHCACFSISTMFDLVSSLSLSRHLISIQDCCLTDREIGQQATCSYFCNIFFNVMNNFIYIHGYIHHNQAQVS